ncbi:VOC family protein [Bacillus tequilensis]|uniref:VOC family protein n=1 Tax=Bacillus tequilensis TaxID=227866 RepID=UPI000464056C|nr:VOC family protein [Bacillus tequilensis]MDR4433674.1 VOC family protein [Bacillus tequilensis]SPU05129.1 YycE [Bacillus tequilensis]
MGNRFSSFHAAQIRIARPTGQLQEIVRFYEEGLGLKRIGEFSQHNGYDGVMFGLPHADYHLEFTQYEGESTAPVPHPDSLLVFYVPDADELTAITSKLKHMGYQEVEPENPYWSHGGVTIEDPDGWRVVFMNTKGLSGK